MLSITGNFMLRHKKNPLVGNQRIFLLSGYQHCFSKSNHNFIEIEFIAL
jgi:hypothetical protein